MPSNASGIEEKDRMMDELDPEHTGASEAPAAPDRRPTRALTLAAGALGAMALLLFLAGRGAAGRGLTLGNLGAATMLEDVVVPSVEYPDPCDGPDLPFLRLEKVLHSNLGGKGPDSGEEGLRFKGRAKNNGINGSVILDVHATSEYTPAWPKENGFHKHFARINIDQGTNVSMKIHGTDPDTNETISVPKVAITFFDLDQGKDNHSVEYVTMCNFHQAWVSNETEIVRTDDGDCSTFSASTEGTGADNPTNPLVLTKQQKNRAVTFIFDNMQEVSFTVGASPGHTARVFAFVVRPVLLCAYTQLEDGTLVDAGGLSPVHAIKSGSPGQRSGLWGAWLAAGLFCLISRQLFRH